MTFILLNKNLRILLLSLAVGLSLSAIGCQKASMRTVKKDTSQTKKDEGVDDGGGQPTNDTPTTSPSPQQPRTPYKDPTPPTTADDLDNDCPEGVCEDEDLTVKIISSVPVTIFKPSQAKEITPVARPTAQPLPISFKAAKELDILFVVNTKNAAKSRLQRVADSSHKLFRQLEKNAVDYNVAVIAANCKVFPSQLFSAAISDPGVLHSWRLKQGNIEPIPYITDHLSLKFSEIPRDQSNVTAGRAGLFSLTSMLFEIEMGEFQEDYRKGLTSQHFLLRENALLVIFVSHEDDYCVSDRDCNFNEMHLIKLLEKTQAGRPLMIASIANQGVGESSYIGEKSTLYNRLASPENSQYGIGAYNIFSKKLPIVMGEIGQNSVSRMR